MNWQSLLSLGFWFNPNPGPLMALALKILLVIFALCLVAAIIFYLVERKLAGIGTARHLMQKLRGLLTALGIIGFAIMFFFWQQVPYLASRFWLIVWVLVALVWLFFIGRFGFFEMPQQRAKALERQEINKYLPKKKK